MSRPADPPDAGNPFEARRLRPGAVPYVWPQKRTPAELLTRLEENGWRGQIVGPHGSGKSALVAALAEHIERAGRKIVRIELHDGQRRLPIDLRSAPGCEAGAVVIVDGYEQLSRWNRFRLRRHCRRNRLGLVVTSHVSMGFPDLARTAAGLDQAVQLVERLASGSAFRPTRREIAALLERHEGDLREVLFDLYDLYERRAAGDG